MTTPERLAIIGGGNIGRAIARGVVASSLLPAEKVTVTRRHRHLLAPLADEGIGVDDDNRRAVRSADTVIVAVRPEQLREVLDEICVELAPARHVLISTVTGASIADILGLLRNELTVVRAMPNTAIAIGESMTCLCAMRGQTEGLDRARAVFDKLGRTLVIDEELMTPATALCACGVAFFLRCIRAASQGGIEVGFHADEAIRLAAQTARGAATLLLELDTHPEREIDKVTTPMGCTIAGLNRMEHEGFSSAMIQGIVTSATKAAELRRPREER